MDYDDGQEMKRLQKEEMMTYDENRQILKGCAIMLGLVGLLGCAIAALALLWTGR